MNRKAYRIENAYTENGRAYLRGRVDDGWRNTEALHPSIEAAALDWFDEYPESIHFFGGLVVVEGTRTDAPPNERGCDRYVEIHAVALIPDGVYAERADVTRGLERL